MITIVRYKFSTGRWGLDFYYKKDADADFVPHPPKWSYPVSVDNYLVFHKSRARLRRAAKLLKDEPQR